MKTQYNKEYEEILKMLYKPDVDALAFYSSFKLYNGKHLAPCYIRQYTINASVCIALIELAKVMARQSPNSTAKNLHEYSNAMNPFLQEKFSIQHTLPVSSRWFAPDFKMFYNEGNGVKYEAFISGNLGNENAVKGGKRFQFSSN